MGGDGKRDDIPHDTVELDFADLWSLEGVGFVWETDDVLLCSGLELLEKFVVDFFLYVDSGTGTTALTVVHVDSKVDPRDGLFDICILEYNVW